MQTSENVLAANVNLYKKSRRRPHRGDRSLECCCCSWPVTQSHHLVLFAKYADDTTIRLCANCHEVFHLLTDRRGALMLTPYGTIRRGDSLVSRVERFDPVVVSRIRQWVECSVSIGNRLDSRVSSQKE